MRLRVLYTSPNYYQICERDDDGTPVILVAVGGIAIYQIVVVLLPGEMAEFRAKGHLDRLAREIAQHEGRFGDRRVRPQSPAERLEIVP